MLSMEALLKLNSTDSRQTKNLELLDWKGMKIHA